MKNPHLPHDERLNPTDRFWQNYIEDYFENHEEKVMVVVARAMFTLRKLKRQARSFVQDLLNGLPPDPAILNKAEEKLSSLKKFVRDNTQDQPVFKFGWQQFHGYSTILDYLQSTMEKRLRAVPVIQEFKDELIKTENILQFVKSVSGDPVLKSLIGTKKFAGNIHDCVKRLLEDDDDPNCNNP